MGAPPGCTSRLIPGSHVSQKRILPIAKRLAIFSTSSDSWHGHPHPLPCPPGRARRSLALYYYTTGRPAEEAKPKHKTLWPLLPGETLPEGALPSEE